MHTSQKSLMQGMSQSIQVSVKQNRGRNIPKNRYLALRVEFSKSLTNNELPPALKQSEARPISIGEKSAKPQFVVTPLGKSNFRNVTTWPMTVYLLQLALSSKDLTCGVILKVLNF